jgi:hypothetical protein
VDSEDEREHLAERIIAGDAGPAIASCSVDPILAEEVSRRAASLLIDIAAARWGDVSARATVWPGAQDAFVSFAHVTGADAGRLAEALLECCLLEAVPGETDQLHDEALRLILDHCTPQLEELFAQDYDQPIPDDLVPPWNSYQNYVSRFVIDAMWNLPGEEGVKWMQRLLIRDPYSVYSRRPLTWTPQDWILRLVGMSDMDEVPRQAYPATGAMSNPAKPPPVEASSALVRYACTHLGDDEELRVVRRIAEILTGYRTGSPTSDVNLVWWEPVGPQQRETLKWLLELCGPSGTREALVTTALAEGLINDELAAALSADVDRPLWADGDVPWVFSDVHELGLMTVASDILEGGALTSDGAFAAEWRVALEPGTYATRSVIAVHPVHGTANAAAELVLDPMAAPDTWELVASVTASGSALGALGSAGVAAPTGVTAGPAASGWTNASQSSAVWFSMPANTERYLWVGRVGSRIARVVLDLGRMDLDLASARPPWFQHHRLPSSEPLPQTTGQIGRAQLLELAKDGASLPLQRHALRKALHQRGVSEYSSAVVMRHVHDGIALMEAGPEVRSRLGGKGRLPPGASWPTLESDEWHLAFLAEIALSELPDLDPLPRDGTLLIYQETETWSCERNPLVATRVMYVPEGLGLATVAEPEQTVFPLKPKPVRGVAMPIPGESAMVVEALELVPDRELVIETMNELMTESSGEHWLLGGSLDVEGPARLDVPYALREISAEQRARFTDAELEGEGWVLLAQINEDNTADIRIGDGGAFYLFIPEDDLRQRLFDRVVGLMQCH